MIESRQMKIARYTEPRAFCDRVLPLLTQREAENNLMISVALRLADGTGTWGDDPPVLYAVEEAGQVIGAALPDAATLPATDADGGRCADLSH